MLEDIIITKANGEREPFDTLKLEKSLKKSRAPQHAIDQVVSHIIHELEDGMSTTEIYKHAYEFLHKLEKPTAIRYSLKRAIMDMGPSGFPFEKLIGELLKAKGFTVETDKMVQGHCAEHEVDIIAHNENKLLMIEAKFHNSLGLQSDLKVALYVKARIDDLKAATFHYGKERKLDEGWLITNTKFTTSAIKYAECQRIRLIGWNYPLEGGLQDMIEEEGLHPITCLTTLPRTHKDYLLANNVVLCKSLLSNSAVLNEAGMSSEEVEETLNEVRLLYAK